MKKSYFAIGAIAAAMCSCSSESIPSAGEGNVLPGTEDLSPISLSMTGKQTTVEVGSRTRGTGNVGGTDDATWQNEKIYILMTSSDPECLVGDDKTAGWGFTNLNGNGPWLREQFNGAIWARPNFVDPDGTLDSGDEKWDLVYNNTHDLGNNDYYQNAGVDRFYPINGESQFFAYHIDDAFDQEHGNDDPIYPASIFDTNDPTDYHYPVEPIVDKYPFITKNAENTEMTVDFTINGSQDLLAGAALDDTDNLGSYSAKSARHGVVPKIEMEHLLSRLKFVIYRGDELAKNIQITGITIKDVRNQGRMIVAYKGQNASNASLIQWKRTGTDAESPDDDTYDEGALDLAQTYYRTNFKLMKSPANPLGDPTTPSDNLTATKNDLDPLTAFDVSGIEHWLQPNKTGNNHFATIGSPMFVAPGESQYEMILDYKVLVDDRDGNTGFNEPADPANPQEGEDLIEKMQVTYPLKAPNNGVFEKGKSYNINITVYGLQPITATVKLTPWTNGGDLWIGGDVTSEDETNGQPENLNP